MSIKQDFIQKIFLLSLIIVFNTLAVTAINIPTAVKQKMFVVEPGGQFRFDGVYQQGSKSWLLLVKDLEKTEKEDIIDVKNQDYLFYGTEKAYLYTTIKNNTIKSYKEFNSELQNEILAFTISPEFLVPAGFRITRDLATISGELPLQFRTTELATDKEEEFRQILKKQAENHLNFLAYSDKDKHFHLYTLNKKEKTVKDKDLGELLKEMMNISSG